MNCFVRCALRASGSGKAAQWAMKSDKMIRLLPSSTTLGQLHKMNWNDIEKAVEDEVPLENVSLQPLYDQPPDKVLGIGLNYLDHLEEQNFPVDKYPKEPVIFNKFPSTIICHGEKIIHPALTSELDYEAELAVIIGEGGRHIPESKALDHVFGYSAANDITARDWQKTKNNKQWILGKSMDTFCPLGPVLWRKDSIADPHNLNIQCEVNGELRQSSNTKMLLFKIPQLISYISKLMTLRTGDIILTGTPGGVGAYSDPPKFLKPGDTVKVTVEGIGALENKVIAE